MTGKERASQCVQGIKAAIFNDKIWMFDRWMNALFSMEIATGKTEYVLSVEGEPKYQEALMSHIVCFENRMLLNPANGKSAVLVDLETMEQSKISIERKGNSFGVKNANVIQEGSMVYMLPKFYGEHILVFDFNKGLLEKVEIDYGFLQANGIDVEDFRWGSGCRTNDGYCLPIVTTTGILHLKDNGEWHYHKADTKDAGFANCGIYGDDIYLLPFQGKDIMVFHIKSGKFDMVKFPKEIIHKYDMPYIAIEISNNKLYLFPGEEKDIIIFDLETREIIRHYAGESQFYDCKTYNGEVYGFPYIGNEIIAVNIVTNKIKKMKMTFPKKHGEAEFTDYWMAQAFCSEKEKLIHAERIVSIEKFVNGLLNQERIHELSDEEPVNINYGTRICRELLIDL